MASFLLLHPFIVALFLLIHRKISSSWRFHSLQRVQTLLSCSFSWQGDTMLDRTCQGMVTPFLEAFSKPPPKSQPPEQLALKLVLISPARTSGPFVFQLGECPYLYLPGSFDSCVLWSGSPGGSCALMVVEGDRTEFNQAGTRWEVLVQRARARKALDPKGLGKLPVRAEENVSRQRQTGGFHTPRVGCPLWCSLWHKVIFGSCAPGALWWPRCLLRAAGDVTGRIWGFPR